MRTITCGFQPLTRKVLHLTSQRLPAWLPAFLRCLADSVTGFRHDAVFRPQKFLQGIGQHSGQFLPGQQLQPAAQNAASDRSHDRIPVLDQIRPPRIAKNAERSTRRIGSEQSANQLITWDDIAGHHQFSRIENFLQVPISLNHSFRRRLVSKFHVDLRAVRLPAAKGNVRPESKVRHQPGRDSQHGTQGRVPSSPWCKFGFVSRKC